MSCTVYTSFINVKFLKYDTANYTINNNNNNNMSGIFFLKGAFWAIILTLNA